MNLEEFELTPLVEEVYYLEFRNKTYEGAGSDYQSLIRRLIKLAGKGLLDIRKEILFAEQNGTLETSQGRSLNQNLSQLSLEEGIAKYFEGWFKHDSFAFSVAKEMEELISKPSERARVIKQFVSNDQLIRIYVSKNLPLILDALKQKIKGQTGLEIIPAVSSFEISLAREATAAKDDKDRTYRFADKYTYGDVELAQSEIKRLYNPSLEAVYQRISDKKRRDLKCLSLKLAGEGLELWRYFRLSHWAAFEEPRKRYCIEGGIVDYLFRELSFQHLKLHSNNACLRDKKFCLEVNQEDFANLLQEVKDV